MKDLDENRFCRDIFQERLNGRIDHIFRDILPGLLHGFLQSIVDF